MSKYIALILVICLTLTLFGCSASDVLQTSAVATTATNTTGASASTTVASTTVAASTAVGTTDSTDPMSGTYIDGIWKWNEPVEMTAFIRYNPDNTPDPKHGWFYEWIKDKMNIFLDITGVTYDSAYDRSALMVASGDLPNVLLRWVFSTVAETELYGDKEKLLVPMNDFLTEEIMPNMCQIMKDFPNIRRDLSTSAGNIYLTVEVYENREYTRQASHEPAFYKISDLKAVGYDTPPATTDELVDAARKLKALDPNGLGEDYYPLAGGYDAYSLDRYLIHAFGLAQQWPDLMCTIYNGDLESGGEFVFMPTSDAYRTYLEYMNVLYSERLIDQDYFTLDGNSIRSRCSTGHYSMLSTYDLSSVLPNSAMDSYDEWAVLPPLTSKLCDTPFVVGGYDYDPMYLLFVASNCDERQREAAFRMLDYGYENDDYISYRYHYGPMKDVDDLYGFNLIGWSIGKHPYDVVLNDVKVYNPDGQFETAARYTAGEVGVYGSGGALFDRRTDGSAKRLNTTDTLAGYVADQMYKNYAPYYRKGFISVSIPEDQINRSADLESVLLDYYKSERAKFITGARALTDNEWQTYCQEMVGMGSEEYFQIQNDAFVSFYRN